MARTLRNLILGILKDCNYDSGSAELSGAELYEDARSRGYDGLHHVLIRRADELAKQGIIKAKPTGRMQSNCYQYAQSSAKSKEYPLPKSTPMILRDAQSPTKCTRPTSTELPDSIWTG